MRFVIVDQNGGNAPWGTYTPADLRAVGAALQIQVSRDLSASWGTDAGDHLVAVDTTVPDGDIPCYIVAKLEDADAIAYHTVGPYAIPSIYVCVTDLSSLTGMGASLLSALGHEILETILDPACNLWADDGNGTEYAREACDATESNGYDLGNGMFGTNFVLPAFFSPSSRGPYSHMGRFGVDPVPGPMQTAHGGYQVYRRSDEGSSQQVTARNRNMPMRTWASKVNRAQNRHTRIGRRMKGEHRNWKESETP